MHPTPLRSDKIGRILEANVSLTNIPIYGCGAVKAKPLGRCTLINAGCVYNVQKLEPNEDKG